ncbi:MAG: phage holin family protein [Bifidobacterium psychraerophilum]|uniref:phage holin family protein n=1 Tax=Bifidobacterium psychraerophilum TaxID=218140 RepID=UPI0039E8E4DC
MGRFFGRWFTLTIAVGVMTWLLPGMIVQGSNTFISIACFALFMALINASVKPVVQLLALPLTILSFGLAALILNVMFMQLASWLSYSVFHAGIYIGGFWWAVFGSFIMMVVDGILGAIMRD